MEKEENKKNLRKYFAGDSSIEEEEKLFNSIHPDPEFELWSSFVSQNRSPAPSGLKNSVIDKIQHSKKRKQRFLIFSSGIAASIILLSATVFYNDYSQKRDLKQKEILLDEAISMFPKEKASGETEDIIYEDEMVIIYLTSN